MVEKISDVELGHVKNLLNREQEVEDSMQRLMLEKLNIKYAKERFLEFLDIKHGLGAADLVHPGTGEITRVVTTADMSVTPEADVQLTLPVNEVMGVSYEE